MKFCALILITVFALNHPWASSALDMSLGILGPSSSSCCADVLAAAMLFPMDLMSRRSTVMPEHMGILPGANISMAIKNSYWSGGNGVKHSIALAEDGVFGIIGGFSSVVPMPAQLAAKIYKIPQVSFGSTSSSLSDKEVYPYFFRTVSPDSGSARALAGVAHHYGWQRLAVVFQESTYSRSYVEDLLAATTALGIRILISQPILPQASTAARMLAWSAVRDSGARVIVLIGDPSDLPEADAAGLIGPDFAWLVSGRMLGATAAEFALYGNRTAGMVGAISHLDKTTPKYRAFARQWRAQRAADPKWDVGGARVSSGSLNLGQHQFGYDPYVYVATAYDAGVAMLLAAHRAMQANPGLVPSDKGWGPAVRSEMQRLNFTGVSGFVAFDSNQDRLQLFQVSNFVPGSNKFSPVGFYNPITSSLTLSTPVRWFDNTTRVPSDTTYPCTPAHYNATVSAACTLLPAAVATYGAGGGERVQRRRSYAWNAGSLDCRGGVPLPQLEVLPCDHVPADAPSASLVTIGCVVLTVVAVAFAIWAVAMCRNLVVARSSPLILASTAAGPIMVAAALLSRVGKNSDAACATRQVLSHMAFTVALGTLSAIAFRNYTLARKRLLTYRPSVLLLRHLLPPLLIDAALLVAWLATAPPVAQQLQRPVLGLPSPAPFVQCVQPHSVLPTLLTIAKALWLAWVFYMAVRGRNVAVRVQEGRYSLSLAALMLTAVLISAYVESAPRADPVEQYNTTCVIFLAASLLALLLLFLPKLLVAHGVVEDTAGKRHAREVKRAGRKKRAEGVGERENRADSSFRSSKFAGDDSAWGLLRHPVMRAFLFQYMEGALMNESSVFWTEVAAYKKFARTLPADGSGTAQLRVRAQAVYDKCVSPNAELQVNISGQTREGIEAALGAPTCTAIHAGLFDEALGAVIQMIDSNCTMPFLLSSKGSRSQEIMEWLMPLSDLEPWLLDGVAEFVATFQRESKGGEASPLLQADNHTPTATSARVAPSNAISPRAQQQYAVAAGGDVETGGGLPIPGTPGR